MIDLTKINKAIADRSNVFYWQTDRDIEPLEAAEIWSDRHSAIKDDELFEKVKEVTKDRVLSIDSYDKDSHTNLGNINSVRIGKLHSGEEVIIRCHPKGVDNGYFYAETLVANKLLEHGLVSYKTYAIHDLENEDDFAFQVISKLQGVPVQTWLEKNPNDEKNLIHEVGATMAKMHQIKVDGFGPFDNDEAKQGKLIGLHNTFTSAVNASFDFNLDVLTRTNTINESQAQSLYELFEDNPLLKFDQPVLVHNDFADWNQLTDGKSITGIIDLDESVGGHPVSDIACWSTFFDPSRLDLFLEGYFSVSPEIEHYQELYELLRLRYTISKMTLRLRKSTWDSSDFLKEKIRVGKMHLSESLKHYVI